MGLGIPAEYDALSDVEESELERTLAVLDATELSVVVRVDARVDWVTSDVLALELMSLVVEVA